MKVFAKCSHAKGYRSSFCRTFVDRKASCTGRYRAAILAAAFSALTLGVAERAQAQFHGVNVGKVCVSPKCEGELLDCTPRIGHGDGFGDTTEIQEAWDEIVRPGTANVRVPASGNLPIVGVFGNTTCTEGGSLPCLLCPQDSLACGFTIGDPEFDNDGFVSFRSNEYVIQVTDPDILEDRGSFLVHDLCDAPGTSGCSSIPSLVQFPASTEIIHCGKCETCDWETKECNKDVPGCCTSDAQCPPDPKCFDSYCNTITNECQMSGKFEFCCTSDAQCPPDEKCFDSYCDLASNTCQMSGKLPGCCTSDFQCPPDPKCRDSFCDLTYNTCELSGKFPGCCTSDAQCPPAQKCRPSFCDLGSNTCYSGGKLPGCCTSDAQCPPDPKCFDSFCDLTYNTCEMSDKLPECCTSDAQCPQAPKCRYSFCDLAYNTCEISAKLPGCCTSDAQCPPAPKCYDSFCDLTYNTCEMSDKLQGCCTSDAQCPPAQKCRPSFCDLGSNTCYSGGKLPGCCTSDAQCPPDPKCFDSFCDLTYNTCEMSDKLPYCCTSDAQCPQAPKCHYSFCDLVYNTCELSGKLPGCCTSDAQCPPDPKCRDSFCDLATNTCQMSPKLPDCCTSDEQCPPARKCFDSFCDLDTNTCYSSDKRPGCCTDDTQCDDGWKCTKDWCDPKGNTCVYERVHSNCDDGFTCTNPDVCDPLNGSADPLSGCVITPNDWKCKAVGQCNAGVCDPKNWVPEPNHDDNGTPPDGCTVVPGPPGNSCEADGDICTVERCSEDGICQTFTPTPPPWPLSDCPPEAAYYLAVVEAPTVLPEDDEVDDKELPPCETDFDKFLDEKQFYVEIYVTEFASKLGATGIACANVDLSYTVGAYGVLINQDGEIEYGSAFDLLPFQTGDSDGQGNITALGACAGTPRYPPPPPKVGVFPKWALLARVKFISKEGCGDLDFRLTDSGFATSVHNVHGSPVAWPVDFGAACGSPNCRAHKYDLNNDCNIDAIADWSLFAACWLQCPGDEKEPNPDYDFGLNGKKCDAANFAGFCDPEMPGCCTDDNCVGPEDFPFMWGALQETLKSGPNCSNPNLKLPLPCLTASSLLQLPTDEELEHAGLQPPAADWEGYNRGILRQIGARQGVKGVRARRSEGASIRGKDKEVKVQE